MDKNEMARLEKELEAKYVQIVALVAEKLKVSPENVPHEEVEELIDNYAAADVDHVEGVPITTPLQRLLAEHHELGERILNIQDEALD